MHTLLSFVISMLLVFRTNTAYDRWWEGRKLWGSLVNNSRSFAIKLSGFLPETDKSSRAFFSKTIALFASALSHHLHKEQTRLELDAKDHPELAGIHNSQHIPNHIIQVMMQRVNRLYKDGEITGDQLIVLNAEMVAFTDVCGACERIKNTPIPLSYSTFLKKFIFIYVITLPLSLVFSLGYITIPVVAFVFYVLASLELIAEEIEDPFSGDANDLPTEKISANIKKNVEELLK